MLVETCVRLKILDDVNKKNVRETLLLKHVHQHHRESNNEDKKPFPLVKSLADFGKKSSNKSPENKTSLQLHTESKSQARIEKPESKIKVSNKDLI